MAGNYKRRILGIAVISAGVCAALPFRNDAVNAPSKIHDTNEIPGPATSRDEPTLRLTIPTDSVVVPATAGGQLPASVGVAAMPMAQPQEIRRDDLQAPPTLGSTFEPFVPTIPIATEVAKPAADIDRAEQFHRIADGDTLEELAERYLGDRSGSGAIFAANRELLTDPGILPVGKQIRIPPVAAPPRDDSDDHLVPIPPELLGREPR